MHSIFVRIYTGMLLAVIFIVLLVSLGSYYINKFRITEHVNQYYSGTFKLIGEGLARHTDEKRIKWLVAIEKLSDLKFESRSLTNWSSSQKLLRQLKREKFIFQVDPFLSEGKVFILVADQTTYLEVELLDFGSSLVRISAFLMLNELGRHKNQDRVEALKKLRLLFEYPLQLKALDNLDITEANKRSIKKGNIAVVLKSSTSSNPSLMAYAPLGSSSYALVLGKIPFFDWFPRYLIFMQIALILFLMASSSFFLVRPLEKRLKLVDKHVASIGHDRKLLINAEQSSDAIGQLANTVNSMAARIERLLEAQNEMVRAISHELRTPISRIRFRMAVLEEFEDPELVEQSAGIEQDLTELEILIDEVLTFSKLKRDLPDLTIEKITVTDFFNELFSSVELVNQDIMMNKALINEYSLTADYRYLFRAIENLLLNALKHANQKIELGFGVTDKEQYIWVSDDGSGVPLQDRIRLFEPFARLDSSRTRKTGGYGLGLAIVKQIADWHNGKIEILDSDLGGSKMLFSWPLDHFLHYNE